MSFDLTTARMNAGYSIKSLARELDVHEHAIRRLERGEGGVHPANAKKVADRFGVQVTDLMPVESNGKAAA
jgi:ribosome-binding protein aMBF1 (putative translation factor)